MTSNNNTDAMNLMALQHQGRLGNFWSFMERYAASADLDVLSGRIDGVFDQFKGQLFGSNWLFVNELKFKTAGREFTFEKAYIAPDFFDIIGTLRVRRIYFTSAKINGIVQLLPNATNFITH